MALWPEVGGSAPQNWAYGLAQGIIGRSTLMERNGRIAAPDKRTSGRGQKARPPLLVSGDGLGVTQ
jgi:hypothetical protein